MNAVRVYSVDPNKNHDDCMKLFDDNGIYVLLDLSLPANGSINRAAPTWTTALLDEYMRTIDSFNKYDNVLAYSVGNEVISRAINTDAARELDWPALETNIQPSLRLPRATSRRTCAALARTPWSRTLPSMAIPTSVEASPST